MLTSLFNGIYKNKTVLITGHSGFKGSWLTYWLIKMGAKVVGLSLNKPSKTNLFEILQLSEKMISIHGDIRNGEKVLEVINKYEPEIIFHLAAQPIVKTSYSNPKMTYETNVMGTINILEAMRLNKKTKALVNITTDKCYENKEWEFGYREHDKLGGFDPYSSSKACSEIITSSFKNSFFNISLYNKTHHTLIATVRAGNVIGGGDWGEFRLIPDCVKSLSKQEQIIIRSPESIRPWQHVFEPLSGYLLIGQKLLEEKTQFADAWNFGPNDEDILTVKEVVSSLIDVWGKGSFDCTPNLNHHEAKILKLDISKAKTKLKWKPILNAKEAIEKTAIWYKEFYNNVENINEYTLSQLYDYIMLAKEQNSVWSK